MKYLFTIIIGLLALTGFAQTDPDVTSTDVIGTGVPAGNPVASPYAVGEHVSFTFSAGNAGTSAMTYPRPGVMQVLITIQNMGLPVVTFSSGTNYYATPTIVAQGNGLYLITLVQNKAIPAGQYSTFSVTGVATRDYISAGTYRVGYQANGKPGSYTNKGADNPSYFGIIDETLPVTLVSFTVSEEGNTALLEWSTTEETNSSRFEVERSLDGKSWMKIGEVASHGESKVLQRYTHIDSAPVIGGSFNGANLYRLRMVDLDDTFSYSRIRVIKFEGAGPDLSVYPNPVSEKLFIRDYVQVTEITISDSNGRKVYKSASPAGGEINVQNFSEGMYITKITRSNGVVSFHKILIKK